MGKFWDWFRYSQPPLRERHAKASSRPRTLASSRPESSIGGPALWSLWAADTWQQGYWDGYKGEGNRYGNFGDGPTSTSEVRQQLRAKGTPGDYKTGFREGWEDARRGVSFADADRKSMRALPSAPSLESKKSHAQIKREVDEILKGKHTSRGIAIKTYETLRALKSQDRAAWLVAAAQLRTAASSPYENDETRQTLLNRAESAEMNARRCR